MDLRLKRMALGWRISLCRGSRVAPVANELILHIPDGQITGGKGKLRSIVGLRQKKGRSLQKTSPGKRKVFRSAALPRYPAVPRR
jgi:hypothetical protein